MSAPMMPDGHGKASYTSNEYWKGVEYPPKPARLPDVKEEKVPVAWMLIPLAVVVVFLMAWIVLTVAGTHSEKRSEVVKSVPLDCECPSVTNRYPVTTMRIGGVPITQWYKRVEKEHVKECVSGK